MKNRIEEQLTPKRMKHTMGVVSQAKMLAQRYGADEGKAELAALCHDMSRCKSLQEFRECVIRFSIPPAYGQSIELGHAKIAAEILKREWGVEDADILNAVAYHTTGRPGMSLLEKIIYLADAIEPGRDYPGVEQLRELACSDLDKACLAAMNQTVEYVAEKGRKINEDTMKAREFLLALERRADE